MKKKQTKIKASEFKFGKFCLIEMKQCKARPKWEKICDDEGKQKVKLIIEGELGYNWGVFDGIGQEFYVEIKKVTVKT